MMGKSDVKRTVSEARRREVRAAWIQATRPRTLPLAAAGSLVAAGIAAARGVFRGEVFLLMLVVSVLLQVISNFADDYGDLAHGLDDETRVGPRRGMQRGIITPAQMRVALATACLLTFALGVALVAVAFSGGPAMENGAQPAIGAFIALGLAAIAAAVLYTVGPHPYGYLGLGDIMSFLFFGIVAVVGGSFLYLHALDAVSIAAGIALGLPVAAVMNINNMRDSVADAAKGKRTIANRLYAAGCARGRALSKGASAAERIALAATFEQGPRPAADELQRQVDSASREELARMAAPERLAHLVGDTYMHGYQRALVTVPLLLFEVAFILLIGPRPISFAGGIALALSFVPLFRAQGGIAREFDHAKLDRFMAPTSMGTVLVAAVFALAAALGALAA